MIGRALDADLPARWVTADEAYGQDSKFRTWLQERNVEMSPAGGSAYRRPVTVPGGPVASVHPDDWDGMASVRRS